MRGFFMVCRCPAGLGENGRAAGSGAALRPPTAEADPRARGKKAYSPCSSSQERMRSATLVQSRSNIMPWPKSGKISAPTP